jgi:transcriptional regulator with XRE-family HTH domain
MQKNENERASNIASKLRTARENAGLSQGQVAKLLNVHRPTISEIEAGRRKVSSEELVKFADLYSVSVGWLTLSNAEDEDAKQNRIQIAARELAKLKKEDLDKVIELLISLQGS